MALGTVTKYNQLESILFATSGRQWDDSNVGSCMWCLATADYSPSASHTTTNDLGASLITAGNGAPIAVTTPTIDKTTTPGTTYYDADPANFGANVTVTAKWLILVQPVTSNTFSATTGKLLAYCDLNTASGSSSLSSSASEFKILPHTNGWFKTT